MTNEEKVIALFTALVEKWYEEMEELFKEEYITSQDWDEEQDEEDI